MVERGDGAVGVVWVVLAALARRRRDGQCPLGTTATQQVEQPPAVADDAPQPIAVLRQRQGRAVVDVEEPGVARRGHRAWSGDDAW
jgi:hypothetical protein